MEHMGSAIPVTEGILPARVEWHHVQSVQMVKQQKS